MIYGNRRSIDLDKKTVKDLASNQCPACRKFIKMKLIEGQDSLECPHCHTWLENDAGLRTGDDILRQAEDDMGIPRGTLDVCMGAD